MVQLPEVQTSYLAQDLHEAPARPQAAVEEPVSQVVPLQQPEQLPGPQVGRGVVQTPNWHCFPPGQVWHCCPPEPQWVEVVPGLQAPPAQQPVQLAGVHWGGGVPQVPLLQAWPVWQVWHCSPP